jgi:hypothetical protein
LADHPTHPYRRRLSTGILVAAMSLTSLSAVACGKAGTEPWLAALEKDRLATMIPPGGRLVLDVENDAHHAFSKPIDARILRVFTYRNPARAARGRSAAIKAAISSGWHVNLHREYPSEPFFGGKRLAPGGATLIIGYYAKGRVFNLTIQLEQGACTALCGHS